MLVLSDSSIIFLNNKLVKDRRKLDDIGDELSKRSAELGKLDASVRSITNKAVPDYDVAKEVNSAIGMRCLSVDSLDPPFFYSNSWSYHGK